MDFPPFIRFGTLPDQNTPNYCERNLYTVPRCIRYYLASTLLRSGICNTFVVSKGKVQRVYTDDLMDGAVDSRHRRRRPNMVEDDRSNGLFVISC